MATGADTGKGLSGLVNIVGQIPDDKYFWVTGKGSESGSTRTLPLRSSSGAGGPGEHLTPKRSLNSRRPDHRAAGNGFEPVRPLHRNGPRVDVCNRVPGLAPQLLICSEKFPPDRTAPVDKRAESGRLPRSIICGLAKGSILRKSCLRVSLAISPKAPANSTPVGPPPTITKVNKALGCSVSISRSAASKAEKMRRRISVASSTVLRPGAKGSQW